MLLPGRLWERSRERCLAPPAALLRGPLQTPSKGHSSVSEDISVVTVGCVGGRVQVTGVLNIGCTARTCHLRCPVSWWQQAQRGRERRPAGPARGADHCGHLSLSCSPKALAGGRGSGRMGSGAPQAFRTPPAPAAAPTGPRAQPADAAHGWPPSEAARLSSQLGGPVGLSTGTRGNVCPHLASGIPATAPPMHHPHPP